MPNKKVIQKKEKCIECEIRSARRKILGSISGNFGYDEGGIENILKELITNLI